MLKAVLIAAAVATAGLAQAQTAAPAPASATKKELAAKVLQLQQTGIEGMARTLVEQPAAQLMNAAGQALQRLPQERREAVGRDIEADIRQYVEEATPIVRSRALRLAPTTIGALLEERFSEDELRQIIALLESPVNRKFQAAAGDMQRALGEKLVAESRGEIEPKLRALETSVKNRLNPPAAAPAGSSSGAGPRAPAAPVKK